MRLLVHRAYETQPQETGALTVRVHHFVVYLNRKSELRKSSIGAGLGGLIGSAIAGQSSLPKGRVSSTVVASSTFEQTGNEEFRRALYTQLENPTKSSVNVIYIDTEIAGRRIATRCLVPPLLDRPNATLAEITDLCIGNHLAPYRSP